jgi:hypothetical protein
MIAALAIDGAATQHRPLIRRYSTRGSNRMSSSLTDGRVNETGAGYDCKSVATIQAVVQISIGGDNPMDRFQFREGVTMCWNGTELVVAFHEAFLNVSSFQPFHDRLSWLLRD